MGPVSLHCRLQNDPQPATQPLLLPFKQLLLLADFPGNILNPFSWIPTPCWKVFPLPLSGKIGKPKGLERKWKLLSPLCDHMDYTVHRILQARTLEWIAFPFSRSSQPRNGTQVSTLQVVYLAAEPQGKPKDWRWVKFPSASWDMVSELSLGKVFSFLPLPQAILLRAG